MNDFILSLTSGIVGGLIVLLCQRYWDFNDKKKQEAKESLKRQEELKKNKIINPADNIKYVNINIVNSLLPGTSISRMKDILGTPDSLSNELFTPNSEELIYTNVYYYEFLNGKIVITSKNDISIDSITIKSDLLTEYPIKIVYPLNEHPTGYLGEVQITSDIIRSSVSCFTMTTARDAYFGIEAYFGNIGKYYNYTFFGHDFEKIISYDKDKDINIFIDSIIYSFCISSIENFSPYI